ncbi:MAG: orotidine-5'-phosphate decarboxylase [Ignavibacteriales bacterium]
MNGRKNPLIVALDLPERGGALRIVERLQGHVGMFKVGMELFYAEGPRIVEDLNSMGVDVFLDLKFHDIPNTVENAVRQLARLRPAMMTVHAQGGFPMMARASAAAREMGDAGGFRPLILAIALLTSIDERSLREDMMISASPPEYVVDMSMLSQAAGIDGVVASAQEARLIRRECGADLLIVTPGIRPSWYGHGDQARVTTPAEAITAGADYIVVGRPVTRSADPLDAALRILDEIHMRDAEAGGCHLERE